MRHHADFPRPLREVLRGGRTSQTLIPAPRSARARPASLELAPSTETTICPSPDRLFIQPVAREMPGGLARNVAVSTTYPVAKARMA